MFTYSPREESSFINETLRQAGISPASVQPVQITEALIELVRAGLGVGGARALGGPAPRRIRPGLPRGADHRARRLPQLARGAPGASRGRST